MEDRIEYPDLHCTQIDFDDRDIEIAQKYPYIEHLDRAMVVVLVARMQLWLKMNEG